MWGQEFSQTQISLPVRIIPTRVGTRFAQSQRRKAYKDHPHACGDKTRIDYINMTELGSSPRVWGQDCRCTLIKHNIRIIPTRVGTRPCVYCVHHHIRDHPHACGDKYRQTYPPAAQKGSSPRVWGQVQDFYNVVNNYRIIPTRVGTR